MLLFSGYSIGQECTADGKLCDTHERCAAWKEEGQCMKNARYMKEHCPASCSDVQQPSKNAVCQDYHLSCPVWASTGECEENVANMEKYCPKSCGVCEEAQDAIDDLCVDSNDKCSFWASKGECGANPNYMHTNCAKSCGTCKKVVKSEAPREVKVVVSEDDKALLTEAEQFGERQKVNGDDAAKVMETVRDSVAYMKNGVSTLPDNVLKLCQNRNELCAFWATIGECAKNAAFMTTNCAPSCRTCDLIDMDTRCPPLPNAFPALEPGHLNKMFEKIVKTAPGNRTLTDADRQELREKNMTEYTVTVHSRPSTSASIEVSAVLDRSLPPWIVTLDDFLTPEECRAIIDLGYHHGYERSRDVGDLKFDGTFDGVESVGRTSENAWCSGMKGCRQHEIIQNVMSRMSRVMNIPSDNSEDLQILKYEKGQFYNTHHDYIPHQRERQCGPRILTFFLYLSDVEAGGGTRFPQLDITVMPKVGRALLWPSVFDHDPTYQDGRTTHEALPVEAGTKFAANGWIHQFDYVSPQDRGCN